MDHNDASIDASAVSVLAACDAAIAAQLALDAAGLEPFEAHADTVARAPTSKDERGLSIAYLIMASRRFAQYTVSRLVRSTYSPHNLYLIHADVKIDTGVLDTLVRTFAAYDNVHFLSRRHRVGWGAFSMVQVLLDGLATIVGTSAGYDFVINLSDSDLALRTHGEISSFLVGFVNTSFVAMKEPATDQMRYRSHAHMRRFPFVECGGEGFAVLNATAADIFAASRHCCLARSGPIVYTRADLRVPQIPEDVEVLHGSQWAILARPFVEYLAAAAGPLPPRPSAVPGAEPGAGGASEAARSCGPEAEGSDEPASGLPLSCARVRALIGAFRYTYMADETLVQTVLANSPFRGQLVSHNMRYIDWPAGASGMAYWQRMGLAYASGPRVLTSSDLDTLRTSEAIFARKVDPHVDSALISSWDALMERKLKGEHPVDQPLVAYSMRRASPTLGQLKPPLSRAEREAGAEPPEPHPLHYGQEDNVGDLYAASAAPSPPPPPRHRATLPAATLTHVTFADGSICHCDSRCRRRGAACCPERIPGCTHLSDVQGSSQPYQRAPHLGGLGEANSTTAKPQRLDAAGAGAGASVLSAANTPVSAIHAADSPAVVGAKSDFWIHAVP